MSRSPRSSSSGAIWRLLLRPDLAATPPFTNAFAIEAARLAEFISPALAAYLLHPVAARYGRRLVAADPARESRLANRAALLRLHRSATLIAGAGLDVVHVGEFANAHALYVDAELRPTTRLGVVVSRADLKALVRHLGANGFRAAEDDAPGAVALVAEDGFTALAIDVGLFGEAFQPVVPAADVLGAAREVEIDGNTLRVPCREHALLLTVAAVAAADFGRLCVREVLDAAILLGPGGAIDWDLVHAIAVESRLGGPLRTLVALLVDLGLDASALPADLARPPRWPARRKFERLADRYRELFQAGASTAGA